jgi:hypothetical protein
MLSICFRPGACPPSPGLPITNFLLVSENYIVGGVPAYSATHIYSFNLDTGSAIPTLLHFGVNDAIFSDRGLHYRCYTVGRGRPRTFHLGYDDPGLCWSGLHGLSQTQRQCGASRGLILSPYQICRQTVFGRSFCFGRLANFSIRPI